VYYAFTDGLVNFDLVLVTCILDEQNSKSVLISTGPISIEVCTNYPDTKYSKLYM
jgi:hypothetical protein